MLGIPLLGSDCMGLREVLYDTPARMVPAGDAVALANGIVLARDNPWRDEATAYTPKARRRFDVANTAEQMLELFEQLSKPNGRWVSTK